MSNVKPLINERPPLSPVFWGATKVGKGIPYRVKPNDTWISVANFYRLNPKELIYFNFQTYNTDEVNWCLRTFVGCNTSIDGGKNWAFKGASIGIIYIPIQVEDMEEEFIEIKPRVEDTITVPEYDDSNFLDALGKGLDIFGVLDTTLAVWAAKLGITIEGGLIAVGALAALIGPAVAVGSPHGEALRKHNRNYFFEGFSYGIIMKAQGWSNDVIQRHYKKQFPIQVPNYVEKAKTFQQLYNTGLLIGIMKGEKFNRVDDKALRGYLRQQMTKDERQYYTGNWDNWSVRKFRDYYDRLASILKNKMLSNNLQFKFR